MLQGAHFLNMAAGAGQQLGTAAARRWRERAWAGAGEESKGEVRRECQRKPQHVAVAGGRSRTPPPEGCAASERAEVRPLSAPAHCSGTSPLVVVRAACVLLSASR